MPRSVAQSLCNSWASFDLLQSISFFVFVIIIVTFSFRCIVHIKRGFGQQTKETSLCSASYVGCQRDAARICCWAPCCGAVAAEYRAAAPLLLSASACYQSTSPSRRALSSKPVARCCCRSMGQTDGRTDRRTLDRFIDPAPSVNNNWILTN